MDIQEEHGTVSATANDSKGSMEVFSLPLLAHLAMKLFSVSSEPSQVGRSPKEFLKNPTHLYRLLLDQIVWRRVRLGEGVDTTTTTQFKLFPDLRSRSRQIAAAVTVFSQESISSRELALRLGMKLQVLQSWAQNSTRTHYLTDLLINFFFKTGHEDQGCEFLHKSFREYLFAEHIVETLKEFGRTQMDLESA